MLATCGAVDRVDGLLPARVLLGPSGQTALLVQVQLEPHGQSIQLSLLGDGQADPLNLSGAQALQLLEVTIEKQKINQLSGEFLLKSELNITDS